MLIEEQALGIGEMQDMKYAQSSPGFSESGHKLIY